jgi:glycosyltransferase involved in cell wall biosynthesis
VLDLARGLAKNNDVRILAPRVPQAPSQDEDGTLSIRRFSYFPRRLQGVADGAILPNIRSQPWRAVEVPFLMLGFLLAAMRETRRFRPDVISAHWILPGGLIAAWVKILTGVPYLLTCHGGDVHALQQRPVRFLKRLVLRRADTVTPVSRQIARALGMTGDEVDRLVIPMGADTDAIQAATGDRRPERGRFLFVGRLAEKKGLDVLIKAVAPVPDARLVVLGDGPDGPDLRRLTDSLGLNERVTFVGQVDRERLMGELSRAYALVIPSKIAANGDQEGTPVVMAEGMAASVPILASDLGGLGENIDSERTGLLVDPGSVSSLTKGMERMLADPDEIRSWASAAHEEARSTLDIRVTTSSYEALLREAAARRDQKGLKDA